MPLCILLTCPQSVYSESLDYQAKQQLIETLKEILQGNKSRERSAVTSALDAFRPAAMDDKAAYNLYENCIRKKEFTEKDKNESEWRKWKNDNKDKSNDLAFRKALQYQFQWAVITLQAASEPQDSFDPAQYTPQILSILESIGGNYKDLKKRKGDLAQNLLQGPVGEVYGVSQIKPEQWPGNLMDVGGIFESLIFPKFRETSNVSGLRNAWDKRIRLEAQFMETKDEDFEIDSNPTDSGKDDKKRRSSSSSLSNPKPASGSTMVATRIGKNNTTTSKDLTRAAHEAITELRWQRELDCCKIGDETQASANMLGIIKATRDSKMRETRIQQLMALLVPSSKSKGAKKQLADNSAFGSSKLPVEETEEPSTPPVRKTRTPERDAPPVFDTSDQETPQEEKKPIVAIVEEISSISSESESGKSLPASPSPDKSASPSAPSAPSSSGKVDDDFFDE